MATSVLKSLSFHRLTASQKSRREARLAVTETGGLVRT